VERPAAAEYSIEAEGVANRPEQLRLTPDERADLVAYVDGELPEAHSRLISTKLTQSATARREVEMLQKTWEMLDHLHRPAANEQFSEKTISHIRRLEMKENFWEPVIAIWSARLARVIVYLLLGAVSLGAGFSFTRWVWPDPTERLVQDLTLAEHLDEYLEVGSFDFLKELADSKEFGAGAH
jgi:anti-sigma factor RsiW